MSRRTPPPSSDAASSDDTEPDPRPAEQQHPQKPVEVGGPKGLEPTRYGDWERNGRCSDF